METVMETNRVIFQPTNVEYVDFYLKNINNPEIYQHIRSEKHLYTREEEIEWVNNNTIKNRNMFTLIAKETNLPIGNAGIEEIADGIGEIGIWLAPEAQNQHYGYEIIKRLIEYGYETLHFKQVTLTVHDNNLRAKHLYKKIGFEETGKEEEITDGLGNPTKKLYMKYKK